MEKDRIREAIAYYQKFRGQMAGDLAEYESGTHYTGEILDGKRVDTTAQTIAELKRRISETDNLIAAYKGLLDA
jgi:hypothetical protein